MAEAVPALVHTRQGPTRYQGCFSLGLPDAPADALSGGAAPGLAPSTKPVGRLGIEEEPYLWPGLVP